MNDKSEIEALTRRFAALGAPDAAEWASSQVREGIPQLARFLFLRQAWRLVAPETDSSWISRWIEAAEKDPQAPYSGAGLAMTRLKRLGATNEDITDLVRGLQAELLFSFCYLLEDPSIEEPEEQDMTWGLVQLTPEGEVLHPISGLHESVLSMDPTGREMRPRS